MSNDAMREALAELEQAEAHYRLTFQIAPSAGHLDVGRAWDRMKKAGDAARAALAQSEAQPESNCVCDDPQAALAALATLKHSHYTYEGGELWKPPLGSAPAWAQPVPEPAALSASEAVYGFAAWLTCRDDPVAFGSTHDAAIAAELVDSFCKSQGLEPPGQQWPHNLKPYPETPAAQSVPEPLSADDVWNSQEIMAINGSRAGLTMPVLMDLVRAIERIVIERMRGKP